MKVLITETQYLKLMEGKYVNFQLDNDDILLSVWDNGDRLELESIVIPKHLRKMGYGTKTMNLICDYADLNDKPIYLTPDTSFGGTSVKRLIQFYKRFGFEKNEDKSITKHFLVRYPQKPKFNKKQYIGQCDTLRKMGNQNESYWQTMMSNKQKITFEEFMNGVDMSKLLDDDENPIDFIKDSIESDSTTAAYVSNWGDKETYFLQTAGFEFIFV